MLRRRYSRFRSSIRSVPHLLHLVQHRRTKRGRLTDWISSKGWQVTDSSVTTLRGRRVSHRDPCPWQLSADGRALRNSSPPARENLRGDAAAQMSSAAQAVAALPPALIP